MRFVLGLIGVLMLVVAPSAGAGQWSYEILGPGTAPGTVRVAVSVTADFSGQCFGYDTCFILGGFSVHISPAPPAQSHYCVDREIPDETGTTLEMLCVAGDGSTTWEIDLDAQTVYDFDSASSYVSWTTDEQGGGCNVHDWCTKIDDSFAPLPVDPSVVANERLSVSALRARYGVRD